MDLNRQLLTGGRVREARLSRGETAEQVAAALNVNASTLLNIEGGKTAPSARLLHRIADHLADDIRSFFSAGQSDENTPAATFVQRYAGQLENEDWRTLDTVARALVAKSISRTD
jgi:transcriptional regulator with XRE-family HTH domain